MAEQRLIDANALMELYADSKDFSIAMCNVPIPIVRQNILDMPTIDAVEVVRCKDCQFQHTLDCPMNYEVDTYDEDDGWDSYMITNACYDDGYCWVGERRED